MKKAKLNWAVFDLESGFRFTDYKDRSSAINAYLWILHEQPKLRGKIGVKQKKFECRK